MKISGWQANSVRWSGRLECPPIVGTSLWHWILNESGCTKDLISDADLDELQRNTKAPNEKPAATEPAVESVLTSASNAPTR